MIVLLRKRLSTEYKMNEPFFLSLTWRGRVLSTDVVDIVSKREQIKCAKFM